MCQVLWKGNLPAFLNSDRTVISTFKNFRICKVIPDLRFHSFFIKHIVDHPRLKKVFRLIFLGVVIRVCRVGAGEQNGLVRHHVGHSLQVMPWPLSKVFTDLPPPPAAQGTHCSQFWPTLGILYQASPVCPSDQCIVMFC